MRPLDEEPGAHPLKEQGVFFPHFFHVAQTAGSLNINQGLLRCKCVPTTERPAAAGLALNALGPRCSAWPGPAQGGGDLWPTLPEDKWGWFTP